MCIIICGNFYSYKNKMSKKDLNLEWNVDISDLSSLSLDEDSLENLDIDEVLEGENPTATENKPLDKLDLNTESQTESQTEYQSQWSGVVDENVFLDLWDNSQTKKNVLKDGDNFSTYIRWFFISSIVILIGVLAIVAFYLFRKYINEASKPNLEQTQQEFVNKYKDTYKKIRGLLWSNQSYVQPTVWSADESQRVNEIINATDIDYIEKKDLLSNYVSELVSKTKNKAEQVENLKQDNAKQWFLPEELETLLSEDQAISTIQRSLNALEVIKFSTATKVFMYMNTALSTISEMIRVSWANVDNLRNLFENINSRWDKDISSYVYMCYLNPFEINANCDVVWDLDLYYKIAKDDSINIELFKNAMNAVSQLLEKEDTSLFSITFNWFNAADKNIQFNIEVYTNQEDEKSLMSQGKRNPNIFILTNIINLLKQSSFIIWADINTKEINVTTRTLTQWWISRPVNYSTMDFSVPIQRKTEREIFDYIDLDAMKKLISERGFNENPEEMSEEILGENNEIINENNDEIVAESANEGFDEEESTLEDQELEDYSIEEDTNAENTNAENTEPENEEE